nr:pyroglutamyl-peptidase 1-like protein [Vulpes vulpes]
MGVVTPTPSLRPCFGPFRQHLVNSSWEAVKELSKLGLNSGMEVELRILQLPVDYREVKQRVTRIWEDLQPQLAVHVGLDASAKAILLERRAKNHGYRDADVRGFRPARGECLPGGPEVVASGVIAGAASKRAAPEGVAVAVSGDAGRYVCEYTYYLSLHLGNGRAALIHVPPLSHWLPASVLGKALQVIIQDMLEEMRKPELKAWFAENSTSVIPAQGGQLGDCLFREN